jgi:hypothetical protein
VMTGVGHCHPTFFFFCWDGFSRTFFPKLSILLISASCVAWDDRCVPLHPAIGWDGVLRTSFLGWPRTVILPVSVSQVDRITGVSHGCLLLLWFLQPVFHVLRPLLSSGTW